MSETPHNSPVEHNSQQLGWGTYGEFSFQAPPTHEVPQEQPSAQSPGWGTNNAFSFGQPPAAEYQPAAWVQPGSYLSSVVPNQASPSVEPALWSHETGPREQSRAVAGSYAGATLVNQTAELISATPEADEPAKDERLTSAQSTYDELRQQVAGMGNKLQAMSEAVYGYAQVIMEASDLLSRPQAFDHSEAQMLAARLRVFSSNAEDYYTNHSADRDRLIEGAADGSMKVESATYDSLQTMRQAETEPEQTKVAANREAEAAATSLSKTLVTFASQDVLPNKYNVTAIADTLALQIDRAYDSGYASLNAEAIAMAEQSVRELHQGLAAEADQQARATNLIRVAYDSIERLG